MLKYLLLPAALLLFAMPDAGAVRRYLRADKDVTAFEKPDESSFVAFTIPAPPPQYKNHNPLYVKLIENGWAEVSYNVRANTYETGYVRISELPYFDELQGNDQPYASFEVVADSVVLTLSKLDNTYSHTYHRGEILPFNREYPDRYALYFSISTKGEGVPMSTDAYIETAKENVRPTSKPYDENILEPLTRPVFDSLTAENDGVNLRTETFRWGSLALILIGAVVARFVCVRVRRSMLNNRASSNEALGTIFFIASGSLILNFTLFLSAYIEGWYVLLLWAAAIAYFFWIGIENRFKLDYRCPNCHQYAVHTNYEGVTKDGVKVEYEHRHINNRRITRDTPQVFEEEEENINIHEYKHYQLYAWNYHCTLCDHRWKSQFRGEYLGSDIRKKTRTTTETTNFG